MVAGPQPDMPTKITIIISQRITGQAGFAAVINLSLLTKTETKKPSPIKSKKVGLMKWVMRSRSRFTRLFCKIPKTSGLLAAIITTALNAWAFNRIKSVLSLNRMMKKWNHLNLSRFKCLSLMKTAAVVGCIVTTTSIIATVSAVIGRQGLMAEQLSAATKLF